MTTKFKPLALSIPHQADEPPPYYAARLAARNFRPARMFTRDMGLDLQRLADGCKSDIRKLADLGGVSYDALKDCALRKQNDVFEMKGQELRKMSLRRARKFICPKCLLQDIAHSNLPPHLAIHGRATWMLSAIRTCHVHRVALIEVQRNIPNSDRHDWTASMASIVPRLPELGSSATYRPLSALEHYLLHRLAGGPPTSWLDQFPFFAAAHVAELIGAVATAGKRITLDTLTEDARYGAGDAGARVANEGPEALIKLMAKLMQEHVPKRPGTASGPQAIFGKLYTVPAQGLPDPAFDPLRHLMSEFILDNFALGPGDTLFGRPITERRLHSIQTAHLAYGFHQKTIRKILHAEGLISNAKAIDNDILFDAQHADRILKRQQDSLTLAEVETHLNAGRSQTQLLLKAGFIKQHCAGDGMNQYFVRAELDDFLSRLLAKATPVSRVPDGAADIPLAARCACCSMTEILHAIMNGTLVWVGRLKGVRGFASVLVDIEQVKAVTKLEELAGLPLQTVARKILKTTMKVIAQLVKSGVIQAKTAINPLNRCPTQIIEFTEIERFQQTYISLYNLARRERMHMATLKKALLAEDINPVNFKGVSATFYRCIDVKPANRLQTTK